jgi:plasmid replication initiation protein
MYVLCVFIYKVGGEMSNPQVVKYHNDFNQVYLGKLNAAEVDLAFDIIAKVKNKGTAPIYFSADELKKNLQKNYTKHEFSNLITSLRRKFFKLDFTVIKKYNDGTEEEDIYNLFKKLTIHRTADKEVVGITLQVEEFFKYLVNNIKINFTRFELEELFQIRGIYAKKIFRLLKQYRSTGEMTMPWSDFISQMNLIGKTQKYINLVLKPAVNELREERTVAGKKRPSFSNLNFKKLKSPGCNKITAIKFTFDGEIVKTKVPIAEKNCPYAERTKMWYAWHHLDIPEELI